MESLWHRMAPKDHKRPLVWPPTRWADPLSRTFRELCLLHWMQAARERAVWKSWGRLWEDLRPTKRPSKYQNKQVFHYSPYNAILSRTAISFSQNWEDREWRKKSVTDLLKSSNLWKAEQVIISRGYIRKIWRMESDLPAQLHVFFGLLLLNEVWRYQGEGALKVVQ